MDNITPKADSIGDQPLVAGDNCPRCGAPLEPGKALFDITMTQPGAAWERKGVPKLQDCLKCRSCGHSETLTKSKEIEP